MSLVAPICKIIGYIIGYKWGLPPPPPLSHFPNFQGKTDSRKCENGGKWVHFIFKEDFSAQRDEQKFFRCNSTFSYSGTTKSHLDNPHQTRISEKVVMLQQVGLKLHEFCWPASPTPHVENVHSLRSFPPRRLPLGNPQIGNVSQESFQTSSQKRFKFPFSLVDNRCWQILHTSQGANKASQSPAQWCCGNSCHNAPKLHNS